MAMVVVGSTCSCGLEHVIIASGYLTNMQGCICFIPVPSPMVICTHIQPTTTIAMTTLHVGQNLSASWAQRFRTSSLLCTYKLCDYYSPIPILSPFLFKPSLYVAILNLKDFSFTCIQSTTVLCDKDHITTLWNYNIEITTH